MPEEGNFAGCQLGVSKERIWGQAEDLCEEKSVGLEPDPLILMDPGQGQAEGELESRTLPTELIFLQEPSPVLLGNTRQLVCRPHGQVY